MQIVRLIISTLLLFLIFWVTALVPSLAVEIDPRLKSALDAAVQNEKIPVIIRLSERLDPSVYKHLPKKEYRRQLVRELKATSGRSQKGLRKLLKQIGAGRIKDLWHINALALDIDPAQIEEIASQPEVASVSLNSLVSLPSIQLAAAGVEWNLAAVGIPELWQQLQPALPGEGITVATIDSGVDGAHPDLANWRGAPGGWFDPVGGTTSPVDHSGHGTAVMGIIAGGDLSGGAIGAAPASKWIAASPFVDNSTSFAHIHEAFAWMLSPDGADAPDVVNNSWALDTPNTCISEFQDDIYLLKAAGIAVVFAAGNSGPDPLTSTSPGNNPNVTAVGATDEQGVIASFSSRGSSACDGGIFPRLVAPGVNILTTASSSAYSWVDGTSFSTPHVAGIMALLLQAFPAVTVPELEFALMYSARDLGSVGPDQDYGYGLVNAMRAYRYLDGEPLLLFPPNLAVDVQTPVTLHWTQRYVFKTELLVSQTPDFSASTPIVVTSVSTSSETVLYAGIGLFALALLFRQRNYYHLRLLLGLLSMLLVLSCGGSGGGDSGSLITAEDPVGNILTHDLTNLASGTTYYWQVQTTDGNARVMQSETFSFTTR